MTSRGRADSLVHPMRFHLTGIAGTGMGSLAGLLRAAGHDVRGSDEAVYPPMSDQLRALGVPWFDGFQPSNLAWGPERVVVGNVCSKDHPEVVEAQKRGIPLTSFPAVLEDVFLAQRHSIVITGTHGKTTTASLAATVLVESERDPSFLIGGVPQNFGRGYRLGKGPHFVVEGDEYDSAFFDKGSKFLHYRPRSVVLTSVELDHVDIFKSMDEVRATFAKLIALIPPDGRLFVAASSPEALKLARDAKCPVEIYGVAGRIPEGVTPEWTATPDEGKSPTRTSFNVRRGTSFFGSFDLGLVGEHNLENALAVVALGASLGLSPVEISRGLARFRGVKRRQEVRGIAAGVTVIDDYAHHPTAVRETLHALRRRAPRGRLVALYEPRSATSRRATFQTEFVEAFESADEVVIGALHAPDKIPLAERFDPERLAADLRQRGVMAKHLDDVDAIVEHIRPRLGPGDMVVVCSSGRSAAPRPVRFRISRTAAMCSGLHGTIGSPIAARSLSCTPPNAPDERFPDFLAVLDEGQVAGCVALEPHEDAGILRSLAVAPDRRGRGFGWMLADGAVNRARELGLKRIYLLTESATDFFAEKLGFRAVDRNTVDQAVAAARLFRDSAKSAVAMRLDL